MELPRVTKKMQNMIKPLGLLFGFLRNGVTVQIWLFENTDLCIEGKIIGFDEYMNLYHFSIIISKNYYLSPFFYQF
ncbi:SNRPE [Blepharisma stoltei]|uniref:Sm protein E n=1 Tax=Blepharisma stoltei TaxID=1481888 RepID=A0AAU9JFU5_9CILI|nr:unnamed protein product [Blepharisma stoltei]